MYQTNVSPDIQQVMDNPRRRGGLYTDKSTNTTYMILKVSAYDYPNMISEDEIRYCFTPTNPKIRAIDKNNIIVIVCRGAQKVVYPDMYIVGTDKTSDSRGKTHNRWILKQKVKIDDNMEQDDDISEETSEESTSITVINRNSKYRSPNEKQMGIFFGRFADHEACSYRLKPDMIYTPDFTYIATYNKDPWILELKTSHYQFNDEVREKCSLLAIKTGIPVYLMAGNLREICGIKFDPTTGEEVPHKMFRPVYSSMFGIGWVNTNYLMDPETTTRWNKVMSQL